MLLALNGEGWDRALILYEWDLGGQMLNCYCLLWLVHACVNAYEGLIGEESFCHSLHNYT